MPEKSDLRRLRYSPRGAALALACAIFLISTLFWLLTSVGSLPPLRPASEAFLYPGGVQVSPPRHLGDGLVEFDLLAMGPDVHLVSEQARLEAESVDQDLHRYRFQLQPDQNWFAVRGPGYEARFSLTYAPADRYRRNGNSQAPVGFVSASLFGLKQAGSAHSRVPDWVVDFEAAPLPAAVNLPPVPGERGLPDLAAAYAEWLEGKQGWPSNEVIHADAGTAAQMVEQGKARIWCGNISNIFLLAAQRAGLQARVISLMNIAHTSVTTSGHVTNELYLPSLRQWQVMDFTLGIYSVRSEGALLNALDLHRILAYSTAPRDSLSFEVYDPGTRRFTARSWAELTPATRDMLEAFYGRGAQLLYRYHPNVGKEPRTFWVRARNRLFDTEEMMVYAPNTPTLAAITWYQVHVYARRLSLLSLVMLAVIAGWWLCGRKRRPRRRPPSPRGGNLWRPPEAPREDSAARSTANL